MSCSVNDVMPGGDGLRICRFWKRRQSGFYCGPDELGLGWGPVELVVDLGRVDGQLKLRSDHGVEKFGFQPLSHTVEFFGSRAAKIKGDLKLHEMCRAFEFCWHNMIRKTFKNCVSLSPRVGEPNSEVKKLINIRIWTTVSSPVNVLCISLNLNLYMYRWIEISFWVWYGYSYGCEYPTSIYIYIYIYIQL